MVNSTFKSVRWLTFFFACFFIASNSYAQTSALRWSDMGILDGTLVVSGLVVSTLEYDADITWSSTSGDLSMVVPTGDLGYVLYGDGTFGGHNGHLTFGLDNSQNDYADVVTFSISFDDSLTGPSFSILDLDKGAASEWVDAVEITYNGGTNIKSDTTLYSYGSDIVEDDETYMDGFEGNAPVDGAALSGNIDVDFGTKKVKSITIKYFTSDDAIADPSAQYIGLSDITYDVDCSTNIIDLEFVYDAYPEEISWDIEDSLSAVVASGGPYGYVPDSIFNVVLCLPDGDYTLNVYDSYGDGMCCAYGNGSYNLADISETSLASGGSFLASESTAFTLLGNGILPIEITYFSAEIIDDKVKLTWETESELDNDFFFIRRSNNSQAWDEIGIVDGSGTTSDRRQYTFWDDAPLYGQSYYYLSQRDYNGTVEHFEIKAIYLGPELVINYYPNPTTDHLIVGVNADQINDIAIFNLAGSNVGLNFEATDYEVRFDLTSLHSGIYFLRLETLNGEYLVEKIVVN